MARLSSRLNGVADGPYEGLPPHLVGPVIDWMSGHFRSPHSSIQIRNVRPLRDLALRAHIAVPAGSEPYELMRAVEHACRGSATVCLDVVDGLLSMSNDHQSADELDEIFALGGSVWITHPDDRASLTKRVDAAAQAQVAAALSPQDEATAELSEAWSNAFGRNPNPSDAWDHAIKAVEHVLNPIVTPGKHSTLGQVLAELRTNAVKHSLKMIDNGDKPQFHIDTVDTFEKMMHFIWPNSDRHGTSGSRQPSLEEAQGVVHLAVTVVQWARAGLIQ